MAIYEITSSLSVVGRKRLVRLLTRAALTCSSLHRHPLFQLFKPVQDHVDLGRC